MGAKMEVLPNPCPEEDWWAVIMGVKMEVLPNSLSKGGLVGSDYGRQKWRLHDMRRV